MKSRYGIYLTQNLNADNFAEVSMLTQEILKAVLHYAPDTGVFTWLASDSKRMKGSLAGSKSKRDGYVRIIFRKKSYLAHRLAWEYVHGSPPSTGLDHKNQNKADNRIANLRLATRSENGANICVQTNNISGFKGVHAHKGRGRPWRSQICVKGKVMHLGLFDTPEEAYEAYKRAAVEHFGEFACFG